MIEDCRLQQQQKKQHQQSFCFVFLLEHKRKVFECVRVKLPQEEEEVGQATVGDVLGSIPSYATEPALIAQRHCGLCSRNGSNSSDNDGVMLDKTAKLRSYDFIDTGEILIAIPEGYNANQCRSMMKRILKKNPKIERLLKRPDPLAPRSSRSAKGKKSTASKVSFPTAKLDAIIENDGDSKSEQSSVSSSIDAIVSVSASASSGREDRVKRSDKEEQAKNIKEFIAGKTNEVNSKREELEALIRHESARKLLEDEIQQKANARESIKAEIEERINGEIVVDKENNPTTDVIERMALEASELETSVMSDPRSPRHREPTRQTSISSGFGIGSGASLTGTTIDRSKPNNTAFSSNNSETVGDYQNGDWETTLNERKPLSDKFRRLKRRLRRVKLTIKEKVSLGENHHHHFPSLAFVVFFSMLYHWYCPKSMCASLQKNVVLIVILMLLAIVTRERRKKKQRERRELQNRSRSLSLSPRRKRSIRGVIRKQQQQ